MVSVASSSVSSHRNPAEGARSDEMMWTRA